MTETPDGTNAPETPAVPTPESTPDSVSAPEASEQTPEQAATDVSATPAAEAAPSEEATPASEAAPTDGGVASPEAAPATEAVAPTEAASADEAKPATEAPPTDEVVASPEAAPATEAVAPTEAAPSEEAAPATEAPPATEASTPSETAPSEDATPATEAAPTAEVVAPAEEATPAPEAPAVAPEAPATPAASPVAPAPSPSPAPRPRPRPTPSAMPKRPARAPAAGPAATPAPVISIPVPDEAAALAEAAKFGRVSDDGSVFVIEEGVERLVGQVPGVSDDEALSLYLRRFLDLQAKVVLFETRLGTAEMSIKEIDQTLNRLNEEATEPAAVGDLARLRAKLAALAQAAKERRAQLEADRAAARAAAVEDRTKIVEAAETIANTDPAKIQWRPAGDQLRTLLDQWKNAQRNGPRIDRPTEEALWKRFSHARTAFDRERRHYFAQLEQSNAEAKTAKEVLVTEAEKLSSSTQWGPTAAAYRDLMTRWKAAGRANRRDDDALWARFRGAQDTFFNARDADNAATDAAYGENLVVKEAILAEAEKLLPVKDLARAKNALRDLQDQWESAGKVPRGDVQRVEGRMRAVETAIRDAEDAAWKRTNPETQARAEGAATQLEASIAQDEADLAEAKAKGDKRRIKEYESALAAKNSWLEQIVKAAEDARGN